MAPDGLVLEPREPASGLLDEPFRMHARGAGGEDGLPLTWRARLRDDEGRVWRASAERAAELPAAWAPAKASTGPLAALQSLRPTAIDVRVESDEDGRVASRTVTRRLLADGVRVRRWRTGLAATLHLPAAATPCAVVVLDATGGAEATGRVDATGGADAAGRAEAAATAALAAPLLASRGALVLVVQPAGRGGAGGAGSGGGGSSCGGSSSGDASSERLLAAAREQLAAVPAAAGAEVVTIEPLLPPGVPWGGEAGDAADDFAARAAAWDALLTTLGATPRGASAPLR